MITTPWGTNRRDLLRRINGGEPVVYNPLQPLTEAVVSKTEREQRECPDHPYRAYNSTAERCTSFRFEAGYPAKFGYDRDWREMLPWRVGPPPLSVDGPFIPYLEQHRLPTREMAMNVAIDLVRNTKVMLPAALAELPKTVSTFTTVARNLWKLGKIQSRMKRELLVRVAKAYTGPRRYGTLRDSIDGVADSMVKDHLAFKFAIAPSIDDLWALCELHSTPLAAGVWKTVSRRLYLYEELETSLQHVRGNLSGLVSTQGRVKVSMYCRDPAAQYLQSMSLNGPSLVANAWELIPLSFVVDAFLPIGDHLSRLGTNLDPFEVWWSSTETVWGRGRISLNGKINTLAEFCMDDPRATFEMQFKDRTRGSNTLVPSFLVRREIKAAHSKLVTYLELLHQFRAKR